MYSRSRLTEKLLVRLFALRGGEIPWVDQSAPGDAGGDVLGGEGCAYGVAEGGRRGVGELFAIGRALLEAGRVARGREASQHGDVAAVFVDRGDHLVSAAVGQATGEAGAVALIGTIGLYRERYREGLEDVVGPFAEADAVGGDDAVVVGGARGQAAQRQADGVGGGVGADRLLGGGVAVGVVGAPLEVVGGRRVFGVDRRLQRRRGGADVLCPLSFDRRLRRGAEGLVFPFDRGVGVLGEEPEVVGGFPGEAAQVGVDCFRAVPISAGDSVQGAVWP